MTTTSVTQQCALKWILLYSSWIKYGDSKFPNQRQNHGSQDDIDSKLVVTPSIFRVSLKLAIMLKSRGLTRYQTCLQNCNVPSKLYKMHLFSKQWQLKGNCVNDYFFDVRLRRIDAIDFVHLTQLYGIFFKYWEVISIHDGDLCLYQRYLVALKKRLPMPLQWGHHLNWKYTVGTPITRLRISRVPI